MSLIAVMTLVDIGQPRLKAVNLMVLIIYELQSPYVDSKIRPHAPKKVPQLAME